MSQDPIESVEPTQPEGVLIFRVTDHPSLPESTDSFYELVDRLAATPEPRRAVLSLADLHMLPSAMIAVLINFQKKVKDVGGHLKICCVEPYVLKVLNLTHVDQIFEIHKDEEEAVAAFEGKGGPGWISRIFGGK